jgi:hypothetical protein
VSGICFAKMYPLGNRAGAGRSEAGIRAGVALAKGRPGDSVLHARYRVLERRDVREAVPIELAVISPILVLDVVLLGSESAAFAGLAIAALAAMGVLSVAWRLGARRHPHTTAFAIGVVLAVMGVLATTTTPVVASTMVGLNAVVVVGCAIYMPWSERWHRSFLGLYIVAYGLGILVTVPLDHAMKMSGLLLGLSTFASSFVGNRLVLSRRRRRWQAELALRAQRVELRATVGRLEAAQATIVRLEGILPICASCKRILEGSRWTAVEEYVENRSDAQFSHGICPDCLTRLYPEYAGDTSLVGS